MKAYLLQRIVSYLIDYFIVFFAVTGLTIFIPATDAYNDAVDDLKNITNSYMNEELSNEEYVKGYGKDNYIIAKETVIITVINLVVTTAYFGTYAYYKNGQTLGKKLMKIKVDGNDKKDPSHKMFVLRTLLIYGVLANIISLAFLYFIKPDMYLNTIGVIDSLQSVFVFVSIFMMMFRKDGRGLHDIICGTKVVLLK